MSTVVQPNENGELVVPRELVNAISPHEQFVLDVQGNTLVARPVSEASGLSVERLQREAKRFWSETTPVERARELREWAISLPRARHLPDEALRRENLYD